MDKQNKKKILVVEDEETALTIFLDILNMAGFEAKGASGGSDALQKLEKESFDLVLLDIIMTDIDGLEVLRRIKKFPARYGTAKIVMLSNVAGDIAIDKAMGYGADGYMLKSETEPMDLVGVVKKYLE